MTRSAADERARMVRRQLAERDITDPAVLHAMGEVPREDFVGPGQQVQAYGDRPLPIGEGQTISQPYIVALMAQLLELRPTDRVLEIGTGSGYAAAVLSRIVAEVVTVERLPDLARIAADRLHSGGYRNVVVHAADGTLGWAASGPYDAVLVSASGPDVPPSLLSQLASGGRLVMPVGPTGGLQQLVLVRRLASGDFARAEAGAVSFVPLIGEEGWKS